MPLAATRAQGIAFLISISGAGVSPAETMIDEARGLPSKFGALSHARSEARSCRGPYRRKTGQKIETPKLN